MFAEPAPWDPEIIYKNPIGMSAYILPVNEAVLNDEPYQKSIYRVNLRTPLNRILGSAIKCYELGMLAFYILPDVDVEKKRFVHKFKDYRLIDI